MYGQTPKKLFICDFDLFHEGVSCEVGDVVFGCALDWDLDKKMVHVSLNPGFVKQQKAAVSSPKTKHKVTCSFEVNLSKRFVSLKSENVELAKSACLLYFPVEKWT